MARKTNQDAQVTRQHILDVALRLFSQQGVSSTSLGEIAKAAGVTRGAIYWHFKDKSDLFSEICELSESNIGELELEYQAKFPGDPLSVLREIFLWSRNFIFNCMRTNHQYKEILKIVLN
ncbi:TetR family transcriptional regulator, partial [Escherichia coli]|uniref:TetR family transcriptional regulator n=1 Tax=Escherichia coli TaxID=562 RepID=UPI00210B098F